MRRGAGHQDGPGGQLAHENDNLVNGEYYLPPGDKEELYALVREVASGYTIAGTTYEYNAKNQLTLRHSLVRDEEYKYTYDARGNMTGNGRSKFYWNDDHLLETRRGSFWTAGRRAHEPPAMSSSGGTFRHGQP